MQSQPTRPRAMLQPADRRAMIGAAIAVAGVLLFALAAGADGARAYRLYLAGAALAVLLEFRLIAQHFDIRQGRRQRLTLIPRAADVTPRSALDRWTAGLLAAAASVGGLLLAGGAARGSLAYDGGFALFAAGVLYAFALIKGTYDRAGRR